MEILDLASVHWGTSVLITEAMVCRLLNGIMAHHTIFSFQKFWHPVDAFISDKGIELQVISSVMFKDKVYISGIATHYEPIRIVWS